MLYRFWAHVAALRGRRLVGILYPILAAVSFNLWAMPVWAQVGFFALTLASCLVGTWLGIVIGDRLREAGVARLARRRPRAETASAPAA